MPTLEAPPPLTKVHSRQSVRVIKVMHLVSTLNIGGLEKVVYDLTRLADRERFDVRVVCLGELGALGPAFAEAGVPVTALNVHGQGVLRSVWSLLKHLRGDRPDVLHTHNPSPHVVGSIAGRLAGVPVIVHTKHGRNYPDSRQKVWANRIAAGLTNRIIAVSSDAADVVKQIERVPSHKVEVVFNGIDLERFCCDGLLGMRDVCRAIHVARLHLPKDHITLLQAVRIVANSAPQFHLDIVGDGPDRTELEKLCDNLQLRDHVTFHGFRHDVHRLLSERGLSLLSSTSEGLSITILEAMASGLPVITTRVGGNPEVVADGETGLLVPPQSPEAMAEAVLTLIRDPQRAEKMGMKGRARVEERFDLRKVVNHYEELYVELSSPAGNLKQ